MDLYLVHWTLPLFDWNNGARPTTPPIHVVWENMEKLVEKGLTKSIGVSNCNV